ncbi:MAG TPA: NAD(P)-dependent oxidoreductase [Solirubrobacteraceae bacterium]
MSAALRIVATAPVPPVAHRAFAELGRIAVAGVEAAALRDAQVLLVRGTPLSAAMIDAAPGLRVIARTGAGYDGVDIAAATERRIPVLYAPGAGTVPLAEGTIALMLAAAKRLTELSAIVRTGSWAARYEVEAIDLHGATLGIIGLGSIGQEVARLAQAFGMIVLACDPAFVRADEAPRSIEPVSLDELTSRADVISLHCALTERTRGMIDRDLLRGAKRGAMLVNVARGAIVQSDDVLLQALREGWLSAVALDVFTHEPPDPAHPLLSHPRVVCTPHAVGLTQRWSARVFDLLAEGVTRVLRGERPSHVVNPETLDPASTLRR